MRLTALAVIGTLGLAATAASARAAPVFAPIDIGPAPNIVQVWGGCGPHRHPVPGHWSRWRGGWVPPHCAWNGWGYRPYAWWRHHRYWAGRDRDYRYY